MKQRLKYIFLSGLLLLQCGPKSRAPESMRFFVGTAGESGIHTFTLNSGTGAVSLESRASGLAHPGFLAPSPDGRNLYAVHEIRTFENRSSGAISAWRIEPDTGKLALLNQRASHGLIPVHVCTDSRGDHVMIANYLKGVSLAVYSIRKDGSIGALCDSVTHIGSSVHPKRQTRSHPHQVVMGPGDRHIYVSDLGMDRIQIYAFHSSDGTIQPNLAPRAALPPGSGPRHMDFHPNGKWLYCVNELNGTVTQFAHYAKEGQLLLFQTFSALPDTFSGHNQSADIHVHPDGKFLYVSNRGDFDSLTIFRIDASTGQLTRIGFQTETIVWPRNFAIDPSGQFLICANKTANSLSVFEIDAKTGRLTLAGPPVPVPAPVCVRFAMFR